MTINVSLVARLGHGYHTSNHFYENVQQITSDGEFILIQYEHLGQLAFANVAIADNPIFERVG